VRPTRRSAARAVVALVAVLAFGLLLVATGCGGDEPVDPSPSPSDSAASPSATASPASDVEAFEAYVTAINEPMKSTEVADAVAAMNDSSEALDAENPATWPAYTDSARTYAKLQEDYLRELEAIDPPPQLADAHDQLIASTQATIKVLRFIADHVEEGDVAILQGDEPPAEIAVQAQSMFTDAEAFTKALTAEAERLGVELPDDLLSKLPG